MLGNLFGLCVADAFMQDVFSFYHVLFEVLNLIQLETVVLTREGCIIYCIVKTSFNIQYNEKIYFWLFYKSSEANYLCSSYH